METLFIGFNIQNQPIEITWDIKKCWETHANEITLDIVKRGWKNVGK